MISLAPPSNTALYDIRIWKCSDFAQHWHSQMDIYICLQGQMKICIEGITYCLNPDDTIFVSSYEAHEIFCDVPDTRVVLIAFGYEFLGNAYNDILNLSVDIPFFNLKDSGISPEILQPLVLIRNVLCKPEKDAVLKDWKLRSSIYAIVAYIYQHRQNNPISAERLLRAKQLEKMYGTLQDIFQHFREPITLEQAAALAGYDRSYFCKQFRKATGVTFHRYLNYCRIAEACRLLSDGNLPLSMVAEQSGFASSKNLSRLFREVLDMTPNQYRKLPQEAKNSLRMLKNITLL